MPGITSVTPASVSDVSHKSTRVSRRVALSVLFSASAAGQRHLRTRNWCKFTSLEQEWAARLYANRASMPPSRRPSLCQPPIRRLTLVVRQCSNVVSVFSAACPAAPASTCCAQKTNGSFWVDTKTKNQKFSHAWAAAKKGRRIDKWVAFCYQATKGRSKWHNRSN